jgi:hypothetical protein
MFAVMAFLFFLLLLNTAVIFIIPEHPAFYIPLLVLSFILGLVVLFKSRSKWKTFFSSGKILFLAKQNITFILLLIFLALLNSIFYLKDFSWDFSHQKTFTLSAKTKALLSHMDQVLEIEVFAYYNEFSPIKQNIKKIESFYSHLDVKYFDIDKDWAKARDLGIVRSGQLLLRYKGKQIIVENSSELAFANALYRLNTLKSKKIYFVSGHGEPSFEDTSLQGISSLKMQLAGEFDLGTIDLLKEKIPQDCSVLVIVSPMKDLFPQEKDILEEYQKRGGNFLFLRDSAFLTESQAILNDFLEKNWKVQSHHDLVIDKLASIKNVTPTDIVINRLNTQSVIGKSFLEKVLFPFAGSYECQDDSSFLCENLATSEAFPASWGETNFGELKNNNARYDKQDKMGPLAIAITVEDSRSAARLIVVGSSRWVKNQYGALVTHSALVKKMLYWLLSQEEITSLVIDEQAENPVIIGNSEFKLYTVFAFAIPLLFLVLSTLIWFMAKKK